jgi:cytochrome c oxidase subunit 2
MKKRYLAQCSGLFLLTAFYLPGGRPAAASQDTAPRRIEIVAKRFSFQPSEVTLKKGVPVVLVFSSQDVTHGIKVTELNLEAEIKKDTTKELAFTPTEAGDYVGHCSHFCGEGHGSMTLALHVTE